MESLVALVIVMIAFGIGMMVFLNVLSNDQSITQLKGELHENALSSYAQEKQTWIDDEQGNETLNVTRSVENVPGKPDLLLVTLSSANSNGKELHQTKQYARENQ